MDSDILLALRDIVKVRIVDFCKADKPFVHADRVLGFNVFIYIVSGQMKIWENGIEYVINERNAFFLKKGLHHYGRDEIAEGTTWYYIHFHDGYVACGNEAGGNRAEWNGSEENGAEWNEAGGNEARENGTGGTGAERIIARWNGARGNGFEQNAARWNGTGNLRELNEYNPLPVAGEFAEEDYDRYIRLPKLIEVDNPKLIERKLDALTKMCKSANDLRMAYLSYGTMELFFDLFIQKRNRPVPDKDDIITRKIILYLESNISRNLSSKEISSHLCMNYNYVSSVFKGKTGMSIMEYHEKIRMNEAARLLMNSNMNISEISDRLGFGDPLYFSRVFKKVMGYSPSDYIKQAYFRN